MVKRFAALSAILAIVFLALVPLTVAAQTPSSDPPATSSLIVKLVAGLSAEEQAAVIARNGGIEVSTIPALRLHVIQVPTADLATTLAQYQADPQVVSAEENKVRQTETAPTDPLYPNQWPLPQISWDLVFGTMTPTGSATVAILDTGVDASHPDLGSKVISGTSILDGSNGMTDSNGHGTWMAGVVAAQTDTVTPEGIAGVAYTGVRVMPVTVLDSSGLGQDSDVIAGVIWAADHGANVILMGFSNPGFSQNLQDAIDYAWSQGAILVAATGNGSANMATFPAGDRGVIGVSATDATDNLAGFSNYGQAAFLAAPGTNIQTTDLGGSYTVISGTSASAAIVAGVAGFMKAVDPTLSNGVIVGRMARMADPAGTQEQTGNGRVNMARSLTDTGTDFVEPAGADPVGAGGPFVGPYVAAAKVLTITFSTTGGAGGTISFSNTNPSISIQACTTTCTLNGLDNNQQATMTVTPNAGSIFVGWSGTWDTSHGGSTTCSGTTNPCVFDMGNSGQSLTATFGANAQPVVAANNASVTVNEGTTATNTGTWSDANPGDTVTLSASVGTITKGGTNAAGTWSWSFATTDGPAQSQTVTITVNDGSGAANAITTTTFSLTVNNVAPAVNTPTVSPEPSNEGSSATASATFSDPAGASDAPFTCTVNYGDGSGNLTGTVASGTCTGPSHTYANSGSYTVTVSVKDKDNGTGSNSSTHVVSNVAPTATLSNNGPVSEGSSATISFSNQSDPSTGDTSAGFHYAFSCINGDLSAATYANSGTSSSTTCTFDDGPSTRTVKARIIDRDDGFTEYTTDVTVTNAVPTATFAATSPIDEGSSATLSFTGPSDPSSADTTAGFHYSFACDGLDTSLASSYAAAGAASSTSCDFPNNGSFTVKGRIFDKDDGFTTYSATVVVNNVAPTATLGNNGPVNEGSPVTVSFTNQSDSSSGDTSAGFHYAFSCSNGDLSTATYANSGTSSSTTCTFDDGPTTRTVKARIIDQDGGYSEYTTVVTVNNVAPTATLSNNGPVAEGSPAAISFTNQFDPSSADTAAGFHYAFSCSNGSLAGTTYAGSGTASFIACTFDDNGTYTVRARIIDKDNGFTEYTTDVTVSDVPPTAVLSNDGPVGEGSPATISFSAQFDPSTADTAAGFHYAFSCTNGDLSGATYAGSDTASSTTCTFNDNGTYLVRARIIDDDNGFTEYTTLVTVNNVAPTATLSNNGPVAEGSAATISFSNASDPSSADTAAGFHYAFSCTNGDLSGATYAGSDPSATAPCTFDDGPSTHTVRARIIDKDDGYTEYTTVVTVTNVAPTATLGNNGPVGEGSAAAISFTNQFDPSTADTTAGFHYAFSCTNGDLSGATYAGSGPSATTNCTFDDNGAYTVKARIFDKDGGYTEYTTVVTVNNVAPTATFSAPTQVNEGSPIALSLTSPVDPSPVDTQAGFTYAFDCGAGYGAFSSTSTTSCPTTDNGSLTVRGKIRDKDGGETEYTGPVTINNVPPTITTASNNGPIYEGGSATVTVSASDPAGANDPLSYQFDCDNDGIYETGPQAANSALCSFNDNGSFQVNVRVTDGDGGEATSFTTVTVNNVAPAVTAPADQTASEGVVQSFALGSFTDPGADSPWTVDVDWGDGSAHTVVTTLATGALATQNHTYINNGTYTVKVKVTDKDSAYGSKTFTVAVADVAAVVVVTPSTQTAQYSDPIQTVTITATDQGANDTLSVSYAYSTNGGTTYTSGLPGGLTGTSVSQTGSATWTITGYANTAPATYLVKITVFDGVLYTSAYSTIIVNKEDARSTYTGALFASTSSTSSSSATVTLAATIQDITAADPASSAPTPDTYPGDIRNATVTFVNRDAGNATLCTASVGLVNASDTKTGTATCNWNVAISGDSQQFTVGVVVNNYYTRNDSADDTVVTVSKPLSSYFITGGGYLVMSSSSSAGLAAGSPGTKNNFGFNVKYNKSGTNLQGNINAIVRSALIASSDPNCQGGGLHVYQIKGNSMTSLAVDTSITGTHPYPTAIFNGKASISDITNASNNIVCSVEGNATLQVTMTDKGEPGSSDTIAITVWNKAGGLWFSSSWSGTKTVEQVLGGGNVVAH